MEDQLEQTSYRQELIGEIKGSENTSRMGESLQDTDVYNGNIRPYVEKELRTHLDTSTVNEMPIVSSLNIVKKIVDQRASLYTEKPTRDFLNLSDNQREAIDRIYVDMNADHKMMMANRFYELQQTQTHALIVPYKNKLTIRPLKKHQLNVITGNNPEEAEIYIISSFDKSASTIRTDNSDGYNQKIGDKNDYAAASERYLVWSPKYHFLMDGHGKILTEEINNPISPLVPIIEISSDKDFEYWTEGGSDVAKFTVDFNASWSKFQEICDLQGHAQAVLKAPENLMPTSIKVGPSYVLKLITDPNMDGDVSFDFVTTGADLTGIQSSLQALLATFLTSQGVSATEITSSANASTGFSSGVERLLSMIEKFEASREAQAIFTNAEKEIYNVVVAWHNVLRDTDQLDDQYKSEIINESKMTIVFERPEGSVTDSEKLDIIERKIELGLIDKADAIMELENKSREEAEERVAKLDLIDIIPTEGNDFGNKDREDRKKDQSDD